jgi:hypothetical protein
VGAFSGIPGMTPMTTPEAEEAAEMAEFDIVGSDSEESI